jgi:SAM-dependent methyltransferase
MSTPATEQPLPPQAQLLQMISGKWVSQAISIAARYRIADHLANGAQTVEALAEKSRTHPQALYRILRALASIGVFQLQDDGRFAQSPTSEFLRTGVAGSMRGVAHYCGDPWSWESWGDMPYSVETGKPCFDRRFGKGVFDYFNEHPDEAATFNEGMTGFATMASEAVVPAYDFSSFKTIVDVGGGHGALLFSILKANPACRGIVFDAPLVIEGTITAIKQAGLEEQCRAEGGDFFQSVPSGDLIIMKHIIHDWNDTKAEAILRSCRKAIAPNGKLILAEIVIPPGNEPSFGKFLDLEMLVICDGKERTEAEYGDLFAKAGFKLTQVIPTKSPLSLVEAIPV